MSRPPASAAELARRFGGELVGEDRPFSGVAPLNRAGPDQVAYAEHRLPPACKAGVLLVRKPVEGRTCVVVADPKLAFIRLLGELFPEAHEPGVHPGAFVHPTARLGKDVVVYPGAWVGADCEVGDRTVIFPNAVLYPGTVIGRDCRVHAGAVLGADGFSFHPTPEGWVKVPQVGRVRIGDGVEVGANSCIDRAFLEETVVGDGSKLDNLIQVGHNTRLGREVVVAAQAGLSGSVEVGDAAVLGGQVGVADHARLGAGVRVGAQSGVHGELSPGTTWLGTPAMPIGLGRRVYAAMRRLPAALREMAELRREVAALKREVAALKGEVLDG